MTLASSGESSYRVIVSLFSFFFFFSWRISDLIGRTIVNICRYYTVVYYLRTSTKKYKTERINDRGNYGSNSKRQLIPVSTFFFLFNIIFNICSRIQIFYIFTSIHSFMWLPLTLFSENPTLNVFMMSF